MSGARQLTLDWPHPASSAREDFLPAPENREALRTIESWPNWPSPTMLLVGPSGSGKSHLGAIWARMAEAPTLHAERIGESPTDEFDGAPALLIEDADRIGAGEAPLFHLLNRLRERGAPTLITASRAPDLWGLTTPDLLSRLRLAPLVALGAPDSDLVQAVLFKLFSDRQIAVDPGVVAYIALRIERSLDAARSIVAALDREAMARGKRVTRAMAAELLRDSEES